MTAATATPMRRVRSVCCSWKPPSSSAWCSSGNSTRSIRPSTSPSAARDVTPGVGGHVEVGRNGLMPDHRGIRLDPNSRHVADANVTTVGCVDEQLLDVRLALADLGCAPHHDVEHLLLLEQVAHRDAAQQGGSRAADVARLDSSRLGRARSTSTCTVGSSSARSTFAPGHAVDVGNHRLDLVRLGVQNILVLAVDAHDDVVVGPAQEVRDPLRE